jgi:hypothetical protein
MHPKPKLKHDVRPPLPHLKKSIVRLLNIGYHTDYELVRTYHPDSPASQALPSSVRHARFHAVTKAYDILRGRSNTHLGHNFADDVYSAELARRRRQHARRQAYHQHATSENAEAGGMSGADDAWKDQVIIVVGLAVRRIPSPRRHI